MLQGVAELTAEPNQRVLENLAGSLRTLKFHLLTSDLSIRHSLSLLLHHLIHHGAVSQVSMCSWPVPDKVLLVLILSMSAGFWHPGKTLLHQGSPCSLCREESDAQSLLTQEDGALLGSNQLCCGSTEQSETGQWGDSESRSKKVQTASAKVLQEADADSQASIELSRSSSGTVKTPMLCGLRSHPLQNLACQDVSCKVPPEYYNIKGESSPSLPKRSSVGPAFRKPCRRFKTAVGRKRRSPRRNRRAHADPEDLYDFVFAVAREEEETTESLYESNAQEGESVDGWASSPADTPSFEGVGCTEGGSVGILPLKAACRFRSVSTLELFSIPLTGDTCRALGNLLSSWVSLEKLVLSYNGLGANIFRILSGLRALSHRRDCSLHVVRVSDVFAHIPSVELVRSILTAFPRLHTLSVSFDLKNQLEGNRPERHSSSEAEIPECNPGLKRLSFHDVNLADYQKEVLLLLQDPVLQEITFSFCRLFESCTTEFLSDIIQIVKRNSTLKSLKLPGNRLGNHRLVALADIFSEDSSSSICQLDVSSNCIKPDGLLEFAKKLESHILQRGGQIKFTHLRLFQNWLDQDAATAQEALRRLRAVCSVVSNTWDSSQAFADYISVM
nr:leucine-rich repeat-containing protein 41 isoform X2 [Chrysemys picta bellii]